MNKVITINLNGNAYQLEENGYEALRAYLETAGRRLEGNPDRDEILADIEQAIADKFRALMGPNKTVVVSKEVADVIAQMGPVEGDTHSGDAGPGSRAASGSAQPGAATPAGAPGSPRRLYKIREGAKIGGVCNGLAAYFNIDVTFVRLGFVVVSLLYGSGVLIYLLMMAVLPTADTPEERAAAQGAPPTAEEFIRRAKEGYYEGMKTFGDRRAYREWKRKFKQDMRAWRWNLQWRVKPVPDAWRQPWEPPHMGSAFSWISLTLLGLVSAALTILWIMAIFSLVTTGAVFGFWLPFGIPVWLGVVLLIVLYQSVKWPLRAMRYGYFHQPRCHGPFHVLWCVFSWILFFYCLTWLLHHHNSPEIHRAIGDLDAAFHDGVHAFKEWWDKQ